GPVAGFVAILLPPALGVSLLIAALLLQALWDMASAEAGRLPLWFSRLRVLLTAAAVLPLLVILGRLSLTALWTPPSAPEHRRGEGVDGGAPDHPGGEGARKERSEGVRQHVEPARVGAEGRHHQPLAVAREAAPADPPAALHDGGDGMEMTRD